jgi:serine protease AprX
MMVTRFVRHIADVAFLLVLMSAVLNAQPPKKYWVYFADKGPSSPASGVLAKQSQKYLEALSEIKPRALERRAKVRPVDALVDAADLPLYRPYVDQIIHMGGALQQQSRWLNAATYLLSPDQVAAVGSLPYVLELSPVATIHRRQLERQEMAQSIPSFSKTASLDYGPSLQQNQMVDSPPLHTIGITGHGVLVGMLDTGFRWRLHESLQSRHVITEYDFIQHDTITANQTCTDAPYRCDRSDQDQHGTLTMSTLGGFMPGQLIGPAFDVDFILGKTEYVQVDDSIWEEDNWASGLEWMEGFGVDVVSSSLGYNTFFDTSNYTWAHGDFNGRTTVSARAAVRAAELGVLVCNAMGNQNNGDGVTGTMLTPADADSIVSVGAVDFSGLLTGFSSTGPTNDARTKPEVVAPGSGVHCALAGGVNAYWNVSGTSLATPLAAGAAALILSARPELTAMGVRDALRNTADSTDISRHPTIPNNFTGWGLVDAFKAALSFGPIFSNQPAATIESGSSIVRTIIVSKFGIMSDSVVLHYAVSPDTVYAGIPMTLDTSMFYPTSGRYSVTLPGQEHNALVNFYIDARDSGSNTYQSPAAVTGNVWQLNYGVTGVKNSPYVPPSFMLSQNYPNPFNPSTVIQYSLAKTQHVSLRVFNVLGQEVKILVDEQQVPGLKTVKFDAGNLPSGVYFYLLRTPSFAATKKMILIR